MNYLVTTTIHVPKLLADYVKDFSEFDHEYLIVVAGDLKTPEAASAFCKTLKNVIYLSPDDQRREFGESPLYKYIPFNSIDRRNFAYLYCLRQGLNSEDTLITIDDDNFLWQKDFVGLHANRVYTAETVSAQWPTWINPLEEFYSEEIFMRGCSPFEKKPNKDQLLKVAKTTMPIAVNQGLWNGSPDVDALTRISGSKGIMTVQREEPLIAGKNIMCPFDTQNTAYLNGFGVTAFLPTYIGRHDDIFSSFITKKIADHFGFGVSYGAPVVYQDRNDHDDYSDFLLELHGMSMTDTFNNFLQQLDLRSTSVLEVYAEVADEIKNGFATHNLNFGSKGDKTEMWSIGQVAEGMKLWLDSIASFDLPEIEVPTLAKVAQS